LKNKVIKNILIDVGHPAHVHLFKNFLIYLKKTGNYNISVTSRNKDIVASLLKHLNVEFISLSTPKKGFVGIISEIFSRFFFVRKLIKKHKFDLVFTSTEVSAIFGMHRIPNYFFAEDDDDLMKIYTSLIYFFTTNIVNPTCLRFSKWKNKRLLHNSYHELAYLHPDNFTADIEVLKKYNLEPYKFIIARHSALDAHHDKGAKGLQGKLWNDIEDIIKDYPQIITKENSKSHQIDPWDMHHVLAFAKLVISDSQTMTAEAAVLGIPSIRYNSFVGRISYLEELEHKYDLTYGFLPDKDENKLLSTLKEMLTQSDLKKVWKEKKDKMLKDKIDLNQWMIELFENEIIKKGK
jgi:predicted glycosyltransferase